jgi:hypothetical protein
MVAEFLSEPSMPSSWTFKTPLTYVGLGVLAIALDNVTVQALG